MLTQAIFAALGGLAVICALGVVLVRNTVHGALLLGLCLAAVGGLFALLGADFLFAAQILIYVSAIAILFLFVVLLAGRRAELSEEPFNKSALAAAVASGLILIVLLGTIAQSKDALKALADSNLFKPTTGDIGQAILTTHALGMEILGVVLLVSLMGATLLTKGLSDKEKIKP